MSLKPGTFRHRRFRKRNLKCLLDLLRHPPLLHLACQFQPDFIPFCWAGPEEVFSLRRCRLSSGLFGFFFLFFSFSFGSVLGLERCAAENVDTEPNNGQSNFFTLPFCASGIVAVVTYEIAAAVASGGRRAFGLSFLGGMKEGRKSISYTRSEWLYFSSLMTPSHRPSPLFLLKLDRDWDRIAVQEMPRNLKAPQFLNW